MSYTIQKIEFKTSGAGNKYARATIDGKEVAIFDKFPNFENLKEGDTVDGDLTKKDYNGKESWTLNPLYKPSTFQPKGGGAGVKAAQERKEVMIEKAQERKSESIAYFNAINSAIALYNAHPEKEMHNPKEFIIEYRDWFLAEWEKYNQKTPF